MEINENENVTADAKKTARTLNIIIGILVVAILALVVAFLFTSKKEPVANNTKEPAANVQENATNQSVANQNTNTAASNTSVGDTAAQNSAASDLSSPTTTTTEKKPDLYIVKYSFSADPKTGKEFTASIKIGNKGKADAGKFHWEWYATTSADKACDGKVDALAVGKTITVSCKYTYGGWAKYTTKAVVDSKAEIAESDESNNEATEEVTPIHETAKADLYISEYKFNHDPKMGEAFTISITIYNKGEAAAGPFWWEWWPTASGKECREKIDSLAAHGGQVVTCPYTYGGWSTYATKAVADADDDVTESDESNNTYTKSIIPIH